MKSRLIFALVILGITTMSGQIILLRELMLIFYGNELSLGISLASWLFWMGFGSWCARRFIGRIKHTSITFAMSQIILAFLLPICVIFIRLIPSILKFSPGELIDVVPMSIITFILFLPVCAAGGFLFVLGCEIHKTIGRVYMLEAIGATVGGVVTSMILIRLFTPLHIMAFMGLLNLFSAILLFLPRKILAFSGAIILAGFIFFISSGYLNSLNSYSLGKKWQTEDILISENSVYGNITVTKRENLYTVFTNGLYDFSIPDDLTSERSAHFPLLEHPAPGDILLIGGGCSGVLSEILKHPVRKVDYVELDPLIVSLAKKVLPENSGLEDPRVRTITHMDGRLFIKRAGAKYDVIIINLPEPHTAQLNRFYTREFYREARDILKEGGILSFSLTSNPNYISEEQANLYLTLKKTLEDVFEEVEITPGEVNYFFASNNVGILTLDWRLLMERLKERNVETRYMREYYLFTELSEERIDSFKKRLEQRWTKMNRDLSPIAYYYDMILWNTYFKYNIKGLLKEITAKKIYGCAIFIFLLLLMPVSIKAIKKRIPGYGVLACVASTGFSEMAFQIVTLISFQVIYGYVYYKLGIILTSYMAGLILGAFVIARKLGKTELYKLFIKTQVAIFIYPLILLPLLAIFLSMKGNFSFMLGSNIFPILPVIAGFIGGFQFPLANDLYISSIRDRDSDGAHGYSAGLTYGLDLFGACLGAILTSVFLIPILGIPATCILTAGLNLAGLIIVLAQRIVPLGAKENNFDLSKSSLP